MTKKRCTDCKYTKGIGYDFWCGNGHTEYEVFMGETNCPYYEYHDWSKGTPSRAKKRFTYENHKVKDNKTGEVHSSNMVSVNVLNELNDENELLKQRIDYLIRELKTEMATSISRNERIRLDFAITVLESLKK